MTKSAPASKEVIAHGLRWSGVGQIAGVIIQTGTSVLLARLLTPADFGVIAMALAVVAFVQSVQYFGTGVLIVQKQDLTEALTNTLFAVNVLLGLGLSLALATLAPVVGEFYKSADVVSVIEALSPGIFLTSLAVVPGALLRRRMEFFSPTMVSLFAVAVQGAASIFPAMLGYGVWALVAGSLAGTLVSSVGTIYVAKWRPRLVASWREFRAELRMCLNVTGSNVTNMATQNADSFVIGRWLGADELGGYSICYRFTSYLPQLLAPMLYSVILPAYSSLQSDLGRLRETVARAMGGVTFVVFPAMAGIAAVADPFLSTMVGHQWLAYVPLIPLLALLGAVRTIAYPITTVFLVMEESGLFFYYTLLSGAFVAAGYIVGVRWGLQGAVIGAIGVQILAEVVCLMLVARMLKTTTLSLLKPAAAPFVASALMGLLVYGIVLFLKSNNVHDAATLIGGVTFGAISYGAYAVVVRPVAAFDLVRIVPAAVRGPFGRILGEGSAR